MTHARAEEYRRLAQWCLAVARNASTEKVQVGLIEQAEFWFRLAKEQDEGTDIQVPVAQQQPQPQPQGQPEDDNEKE